MLKPVGSRCNMTYDYCYYQEKTMFYKDSAGTLLDEELLEHFVREYIESQTQREVLFTWHGGEPLLRPLSFYRKALELQRRYARGRHIDNCLQTNGTLLTPEWCNFFRENGFLIGISIDGPRQLHDAYRHMRATRNETRTGRETHIKSDGSSWLQAMYGQRQQTFGRRKTGALPRQCRECRWLFACHGECPKNRFVNDRYGNPGLNYLCEGYRQFFCHVAADMDFMTRELAAGRPPANIMLRFPQPADSR